MWRPKQGDDLQRVPSPRLRAGVKEEKAVPRILFRTRSVVPHRFTRFFGISPVK